MKAGEKEKMEKYEALEMEVIELDSDDVIMTSDTYKQRGLEAYIIPIETFADDGEIPEDNTGE